MNGEVQKLELIQLILSLQDNQLLFKIQQLLQPNAAPRAFSTPRPARTNGKKKRKYGFAKGKTLYIAPDFNETPAGFEDYMQTTK